MGKSRKKIAPNDYDIVNRVLSEGIGQEDWRYKGPDARQLSQNYLKEADEYWNTLDYRVLRSAQEKNVIYDEDMNPLPFYGEDSPLPYKASGGWSDTGRIPTIVTDMIGEDGTKLSEDRYKAIIEANPDIDPEEAMAKAKAFAAEVARKSFEGSESSFFANIPIFDKLYRIGQNAHFEFKPLITVYDPVSKEYVAKIPTDEELEIRGGVKDVYGPADPNESIPYKFIRNFNNAMADIPYMLMTANKVTKDLALEGTKIVGDLTGLYDVDEEFLNSIEKSPIHVSNDFYDTYKKSKELSTLSGYAPKEEDSFSPEWWAANLGQGAASLASYSILGRMFGGGKAGMWTAGMILNGGEAYDAADEAGLSDIEKALMFSAVGAINTLVEVGIGNNAFQKWLVGHNGAKELPKIILKEVGGDVSKLKNQAVKKSIADKVMSAATYVNEIPIVGQALEEGSEELIQTLVGKTAEAVYNNTFGKGKKAGEGRYEDVDFREAFIEAFEAAAIGAVLGGAGGGLSLLRKKEENDSIIPYITKGRVDVVKGQLAELLNNGSIDEGTYENYLNRVDHLDELWNKNKEAFKNINSKHVDSDVVKATALSLIDTEFNLKQKRDQISKELSENNSNPDLSDAVKKENAKKISARLLNINKRIESVSEQISDYMADENGEIKAIKKIENTKKGSEFLRNTISRQTESKITDEQFNRLLSQHNLSENKELNEALGDVRENGLSDQNKDKLTSILGEIDLKNELEKANKYLKKQEEKRKKAEAEAKEKERLERIEARKSKKQKEKERLAKEAEAKAKAEEIKKANSEALKKELEEAEEKPADSTEEESYKESVSPQAKKYALENNISAEEVNSIEGTGADGAVTKKDIQKYIDSKKEESNEEDASTEESEDIDSSEETEPTDSTDAEGGESDTRAYDLKRKKALEDQISALEKENSVASKMILPKLKNELSELNAKLEVEEELASQEKSSSSESEQEESSNEITEEEANVRVQEALKVVHKALEDGREAVLQNQDKEYSFLGKVYQRVSSYIGHVLNISGVRNLVDVKNSQPVGQVIDTFGKMYFDNQSLTLNEFKEALENHKMSGQFNNILNDKEGFSKLFNELKSRFEPVLSKLKDIHGEGAIFVTGDIFVYKEDVSLSKGYNGVAGMIDMVVVDESGDIHVYDFKTRTENTTEVTLESLENKGYLESFSRQLTAYANLIQGSFEGNVSINAIIVPVKYTKQNTNEKEAEAYRNKETRSKAIEDFKPSPSNIEISNDIIVTKLDNRNEEPDIRKLLTFKKTKVTPEGLSSDKEAVLKKDKLDRKQKDNRDKKRAEWTTNPDNNHAEAPVDVTSKRVVGNTITSLNIKYTTNEETGFLEDDTNEDRLSIVETFDSRLQDPDQFKKGDKVSLIVPTKKQLDDYGYDLTEEEYNNKSNDVGEFPIAFVDESGKIIGFLPTQSGIKRNVDKSNPKNYAIEEKKNLDIRKKIFENKSANIEATIISKSTGTPMFQKKSQTIYDALGDGTRLADNVTIGISKGKGALQIGAGGVEFEGEIEYPPGFDSSNYYQEGVVYAIVPNAKGTYFALPMDINRLNENQADTIIKILQLYKANEKNEKDAKLIEERDFLRDSVLGDLSDPIEVIKIMRNFFYIDETDIDYYFKIDPTGLFLDGINPPIDWKDFRDKKEVRDQVKAALMQKFNTVRLSSLNKTFIQWKLVKNDKGEDVLSVVELPNYLDYLNNEDVLRTNIQSEPISGTSNKRYFTAQSVIEVDNFKIETKQLEQSKTSDVSNEESSIRRRWQEALKYEIEEVTTDDDFLHEKGTWRIVNTKENPNNEGLTFTGKTKQEVKDKINAKYNEELTYLKQPKTSSSEEVSIPKTTTSDVEKQKPSTESKNSLDIDLDFSQAPAEVSSEVKSGVEELSYTNLNSISSSSLGIDKTQSISQEAKELQKRCK